MKEKAIISAVIYVNKNDKGLLEFIKKIDRHFSQYFDIYEVIVINDGGSEETKRDIRKLGKSLSGNVTIINLPWTHNIETAMLSGTDIALGDFIYEFDHPYIDYPLSLLSDLYEKATSGYDIITAIPKNGSQLSSRIFYKFLNIVSYLHFDFSTETVRIISRRALNMTLRNKDKIRYRKALYKYSGFPITSIYYKPQNKIQYSDKSLSERISLATNILVYYSNFGFKITIFLSLLFFLFSIAGGIYSIYTYLTDQDVVTGWTTLMLFLSLGFSGVFFVLGIIGKYISVILTEIIDRPSYVVESVEKIMK